MGLADTLPFDALLLEGPFFFSAHNGCLYCQTPQRRDAVHVEDALKPYIGQRVRLAAHRLPPKPPYPPKMDLYGVTGEGVLRAEPVEQPPGLPSFGLRYKWSVDTFEGTVVPLTLERLNGHEGRLACVSLVDAERMRDIVTAAGLDVLGVQTQELSDLVGRFKKVAASEDEKG